MDVTNISTHLKSHESNLGIWYLFGASHLNAVDGPPVDQKWAFLCFVKSCRCHISVTIWDFCIVVAEPIHDDVIKWNLFGVIGLLCGDFTCHRWIPLTKASDAELWCFLWPVPWINGWVNNSEAGDLRRHRAHYDVIVLYLDTRQTESVSRVHWSVMFGTSTSAKSAWNSFKVHLYSSLATFCYWISLGGEQENLHTYLTMHTSQRPDVRPW